MRTPGVVGPRSTAYVSRQGVELRLEHEGRYMLWNATTDRNTLDSGATLKIENAFSDTPLLQGEEIAVVHGSGHLVTLTIVSAAADRLEVSDGSRYLTLKPSTAVRADVVDDDERSRTRWIVS